MEIGILLEATPKYFGHKSGFFTIAFYVPSPE
jgi:hypothetical protein